MIHQEEIEMYLIAFTFATGEDFRGLIPVVCKYDSTDPFAVTLTFDEGKDWTFSRDLIAEALVSGDDRTHGEGDVQVQCDGGWVRIYFTPPHGTMTARMIKTDLIEFIDDTVKIVGPEDDETKIAASELDDVLAMILSESKGN